MADEQINELRAMAHPLRLQMLSLLTGAEMSAAEVARELGISHASASYHLRTLHRAGHIVVSGEERIRGGVARRYRYVSEEAPTPPSRRRQRSVDDLIAYAEVLGVELRRRLLVAAPARRQFHSDIEAWVEPEVWAEAVDLLHRASRMLHEQARPPRTTGTRHVSVTAWAFPMDEEGPDRR